MSYVPGAKPVWLVDDVDVERVANKKRRYVLLAAFAVLLSAVPLFVAIHFAFPDVTPVSELRVYSNGDAPMTPDDQGSMWANLVVLLGIGPASILAPAWYVGAWKRFFAQTAIYFILIFVVAILVEVLWPGAPMRSVGGAGIILNLQMMFVINECRQRATYLASHKQTASNDVEVQAKSASAAAPILPAVTFAGVFVGLLVGLAMWLTTSKSAEVPIPETAIAIGEEQPGLPSDLSLKEINSILVGQELSNVQEVLASWQFTEPGDIKGIRQAYRPDTGDRADCLLYQRTSGPADVSTFFLLIVKESGGQYYVQAVFEDPPRATWSEFFTPIPYVAEPQATARPPVQKATATPRRIVPTPQPRRAVRTRPDKATVTPQPPRSKPTKRPLSEVEKALGF